MRNSLLSFLLATTIMICLGKSSYAINDTIINDLWITYNKEGQKDIRLSLLLKIGDSYYKTRNFLKRDSVFQLAITNSYLEATQDNELMSLYSWYFSKEYTYSLKESSKYAEQMEHISKNTNNELWSYDASIVSYNIALAHADYAIALSSISKANYLANILNDEKLKARSLLYLGECEEASNNKLEAFKNYNDALYVAKKIDDDTIVYACYDALSSFFRIIKKYDKAKEYKQKQFGMILKSGKVDSTKLILLYKDLSNILLSDNDREQGEKILFQEINFAFRNKDNDLKDKLFKQYRKFLIDNDLLHDLDIFYTQKYPDELKKIAQTDTALYYRLMAYIKEADKNMDSAAYYYKAAEEKTLQQSHDNIFIANLYKRYGQFAIRKGDIPLAKEQFIKSYGYARQGRYFPYIIDATSYLDTIFANEKNYPLAYQYEQQNRLYTDSQASVTKENELLLLEIDNENRLHELKAEKDLSQKEKHHNLEYIGILIFIIFLFIVLVMLGSFKVHKVLIKSANFITFILLFEFIVMLTDTKVENFTQGEPWKILLFKLFIISIITPIHHKLEHKLLGYLYEHKLIDPSLMKLRPLIANIIKKMKDEEDHHNDAHK